MDGTHKKKSVENWLSSVIFPIAVVAIFIVVIVITSLKPYPNYLGLAFWVFVFARPYLKPCFSQAQSIMHVIHHYCILGLCSSPNSSSLSCFQNPTIFFQNPMICIKSQEKKKIRIFVTNLIYKWILGFMCESYALILVLLNLTIHVNRLSGNSFCWEVNIENFYFSSNWCSEWLIGVVQSG